MLHPVDELAGLVPVGKRRLDHHEGVPVSRSSRGLRQFDGTQVKSGLSK